MTINEAIDIVCEHDEIVDMLKELKLLREELKSHIIYDRELAETKMFQLGFCEGIKMYHSELHKYMFPNELIDEIAEQLINNIGGIK